MITISIVSHGHGEMVKSLVESLLKFAEISKIIITHNIPEVIAYKKNNRVIHIHNQQPRGFAYNHNKAFICSSTEFFCVLNPDIEIIQNPFQSLIDIINSHNADIVAPLVFGPNGDVEDSVRHFPTLGMLLLKLLGVSDGRYKVNLGFPPFEPDWVAGMFLLFRSCAYRYLEGFDESYFLYYEDVDICRRAHQLGIKILYCPKVSVVHHAQRDSRKSFRNMRWHLISMCRYLRNSGK